MKKILFFFFCIFLPLASYCQLISLNNSVVDYLKASTPQAYQFQKYGQVPVNANTGLVNLTIPFFSLKIKGVSWDIGISYQTGGIKVNEISGCVGLGWNLNAAGMISAKMMQGSDALIANMGDSTVYRNGFNLGFGTDPAVYNCDYPAPGDIGFVRNFLEQKPNGDYRYFNYAPDVFFLNAGNLNCKFFLKDKKGYCMPARDLSIQVFNTPTNFFVVTDENGNKYRFEEKGGNSGFSTFATHSLEGPGGSGDPLSNNPNFMLTKIENPFGETIIFHYTLENYTYRGADSDVYIDKNYSIQCTDTLDGMDGNQHRRTWSYVQEARINSIETSSGEKVVFSYTARDDLAGASKLDKVTLYSLGFQVSEKVIRSFKLYNSYFGTGTDVRNLRLKLDSVKEMNNSLQTLPGYHFEYDPMGLPSRISASQDSAGYYNGKPNVNLVPFYGGDRSFSLVHTRACALKRITYPTGGETEFDYELKKTGGLRIKRARDYALGQIAGDRSYEYFEPVGGPALNFEKEFVTYDYYCHGNGPKLQAACSRVATYSTPVISFTDSYYYIGESTERYRRIVEYHYNGLNGKVEFLYGGTGLPYRNGVMGQDEMLRETNTYKMTDSGYELIKSERRNYFYFTGEGGGYSLDHTSLRETRLFGFDFDMERAEYNTSANECSPGDPGGGGSPSSLAYCYPARYHQFYIRLVSTPVMVSEEISEDYVSGTVLVSKKEFGFEVDKTILPVWTAVTGSDGSRTVDSMRYPVHFAGLTATDPVSAGIRNLQTMHVFTPVEKSRHLFNVAGTRIRLVNAAFTSFKNNLPLPDTLFAIESQLPLLDYTSAGITGGAIKKDSRYEKRILFTRYDAKGNLLEQQKVNDVKHAYIYDYQSTLPIAVVQHAGSDDIAFSSFEYDGTGNWVRSGGTFNTSQAMTGSRCLTMAGTNTLLKSNLSASQTYEVSYWVKDGNMTVNDSSGVQKDSKLGWNLLVHQVSGATTITVAGNGLIDDLRLMPANAEMSTYHYEPSVGILAQTDARHQVVFYEYDTFWKLLHIRDGDKNIIQKIAYQFRGKADPLATWTPTGNQYCKPCEANTAYITNILVREESNTNPASPSFNWTRWVEVGPSSSCVVAPDWQNTSTPLRCGISGLGNTGYLQQEQKDMNPCSGTYNTIRWVNTVVDCAQCPKPANWQRTGNLRCQKDGNNQNTGFEEAEERDIESCNSPTYNQIRWVYYRPNTTACPTSLCNWSNCNAPNQKCINDVCHTGIKVYTISRYDSGSGMYECTFHYEWYDGSWSPDDTEYNSEPCAI